MGDCFVVLSADGRFWDGKAWTDRLAQACRFDGPIDPSTACERLAIQLKDRGFPCSVAYIPRAEVAVA